MSVLGGCIILSGIVLSFIWGRSLGNENGYFQGYETGYVAGRRSNE